MLKPYRFMSLAIVLPILAGCAHSTMRGSVAMKTSADEAHVCMGNNEVKAGDRVALFDNQCTGDRGKQSNNVCEKVKLGEGMVERTLNEHYSVVKVDPGVKFKEGTIVEKE